ncbi:CoA transferase [Fulvimarina sp. MAC3]|uniref:CoA transferase n=1 Tax=Fulvimarina sp. MAC3 TaxID=3148887 RepID=UPI0031FC0F45
MFDCLGSAALRWLEGGRDVVRALSREAEILVENFRVGRMEEWGLGYEALKAINPRLIMVRVTGFGQNVTQSLDQLRAIVSETGRKGAGLRVDLATAFDCPIDGTVPLDDVRRVFAEALRIAPKAEFALCNTTGRADPMTVAKRFRSVMTDASDEIVWAFHGHDTFWMGVANALYAFDAGVTIIEGAAAGPGGCPFAPGTTGNTATEDLQFAFEQGGISTGIDRRKLLEVADRIAALPRGKTAIHPRIVPRERTV